MLLLLVSTSVNLLLVELLFRFYLFGMDSLSIEKVNSTHSLGESGLIAPARLPELIYELKPNLSETFKMVPFETNSKGLRDKEYSLTAPDTFRVAVIGDSLTMGSGVSIDKTFHSLLENRFNQEQYKNTFEFINFGVGGYSLRQYLGVLNTKAKAYNPDIVLIGFYPGNDHHIVVDEKFKTPYIVKEKRYPFYGSFVLRELSRLGATWRTSPQRPRKEEIEYVSEIFQEFGEYSKSHNVPVVIVYLTVRTDHSVRPELIKNISNTNGLGFVDVSWAFDQKSLSEYAIYPSDFHPNAKANSKFANQIYEYLFATSLVTKTSR